MYLKIKGFPYLNGEMRYKNRIPVDERIGTREKKKIQNGMLILSPKALVSIL